MAKLAREMVLNRNHTLVSTYGHCVRFEKGKPTTVPAVLHGECLGIGAEFTDGKDAVVEEPAGPQEPTDPAERKAALVAAIGRIVERNASADFTAGGMPKESALEREFGWRVNYQEIKGVWQAYREAEAEKNA